MSTPTWISSGKARLAAQTRGVGPTVIFLHAGVADRRMWQGQVDALGSRFCAVAYDRRGFGESAHVDEPYSQVRDLVAVLDALSPATPAILVGCSQGGRIAIDMALARPERVRALMLVAPAISGAPQYDPAPPVAALERALEAAEAAGDLERINELEAQAWLDGPFSPPGRVAGAVRDLFLDMNGRALRAVRLGEEVPPPSAFERAARIAAPALVAWGDLDFPEVAAKCRDFAARMPHARTLRFEGAAHLPNLEQADKFNQALLAFCTSLALLERIA